MHKGHLTVKPITVGFTVHFPSWVLNLLTLAPCLSKGLFFKILLTSCLIRGAFHYLGGFQFTGLVWNWRQRRLVRWTQHVLPGRPPVIPGWDSRRDWGLHNSEWEREPGNSFYYAQNDPVFTTLRATRVIHTHFEKESVVYQMCSLFLLQYNRTRSKSWFAFPTL